MALFVELVSDSLVLLVGVALLAYLYRLSRVFRGGAVSRAFDYFVLAVVIACLAFSARIVLDTLSISSELVLVPVRDAAVGAIMLVLIFGLRKASKIWPRSG